MTDTKFMSQLPPRARSQLCSSASGPAPAAVSERQAWNSGCQVPKVIPPTGVGPGWGGGVPCQVAIITLGHLTNCNPSSTIAPGGCLPSSSPSPSAPTVLSQPPDGGSADNRLPPQVASLHLHPSLLASLLDPSTDFAETPQTSTRSVLLCCFPTAT